jgi:hypothetical protein
LKEFKKAIEAKFKYSEINYGYTFPRTIPYDSGSEKSSDNAKSEGENVIEDEDEGDIYKVYSGNQKKESTIKATKSLQESGR